MNKWGVYYDKVVGDVLENKWKPETVWWGLKEGAIDLGAYNPVVPEDVKALVETRKKGIIDGSAPIWKGPLKDNTGKEVLAAGVTADDKWKGEVNFYVEGVDGKLPSAK
jgi:simple sugar transport system substrate-binding protein